MKSLRKKHILLINERDNSSYSTFTIHIYKTRISWASRPPTPHHRGVAPLHLLPSSRCSSSRPPQPIPNQGASCFEVSLPPSPATRRHSPRPLFTPPLSLEATYPKAPQPQRVVPQGPYPKGVVPWFPSSSRRHTSRPQPCGVVPRGPLISRLHALRPPKPPL